jgi:hypothetical protein
LKLLPFGLDKFTTGRTFVFLTTAIKQFALKSATGGDLKGPATTPSATQLSSASVNLSAFS